jgi:hypothetical protein
MRTVAIAKHLDVDNNIRGFRLFNLNNHEIFDLSTSKIVEYVESGKLTVENLLITNGDIRITQGTTGKLPKLKNGKRLSINNCLTVIGRLGNEGYLVVNYNGDIQRISNIEAYYYAKHFGFTNAKQYEKGKRLSGSFNQMKISSETLEEFKSRETAVNRANNRLKLLASPYLITPDFTIEIQDYNISELNILAPVDKLTKNILLPCRNLRKIVFPHTYKEIDISILTSRYGGRLEVELYEGTQVLALNCIDSRRLKYNDIVFKYITS